ncbi:MAG: HEAT repeat domain-containing protein [Acidobacteriota bacterium]
MRFKPSIITLLLLALFTIPVLCSGQVIKLADSQNNLAGRVEEARLEASRRDFSGGFWIGYSVPCLMGEYSFIYSTKNNTVYGNFHFRGIGDGPALKDILSGKSSLSTAAAGSQDVRKVAEEALNRMDNPQFLEKKVLKDVAVLFLFNLNGKTGEKGSRSPVEIAILNTDLPFKTGDHTLIWMGEAEADDSLSLLVDIFRRAKEEDLKKRLLTAVGLHRDSERAVDFLIEIAGKADSREIRKAAVSTLGDIASHRAAEELGNLVYTDDDTEVQKRAVSAIEDLPTDMGLPLLIKIAKSHPKSLIRKRAISCLGDCDDPRALDALIDILKK